MPTLTRATGRWGATTTRSQPLPTSSKASVRGPSGSWGPTPFRKKRTREVLDDSYELYLRPNKVSRGTVATTPSAQAALTQAVRGECLGGSGTEVLLAQHSRIGFRDDNGGRTAMEGDASLPAADVSAAGGWTLPPPRKALVDLDGMKTQLVHTVCGSLIREPRLHQTTDRTRQHLEYLVKTVALLDAEFPLKVALYCRHDLNIRVTTNFLLALAADLMPCRAHFRRYYPSAIRLPSDYLDVVSLFFSLEDRHTCGKSLPSVLRRAMIDKFVDFDAYQLAKYKSKGKTKKAKKGDGAERPGIGARPKPTGITMKAAIRMLHICRPVEHVMAILGKKYPATESEFQEASLPGAFEPERAGKRMKLPTPETWETALSAKGNRASTWQGLIDRLKLPYMALLRNVRNLLLAGISEKHHAKAIERIRNERQVINSRQFPFRFFSAYDAVAGAMEAAEVRKEKQARRNRKVAVPNPPTDKLLERYMEALDDAVKIATKHNCRPIQGRTVIFCDVSMEECSDEGATGKNSGMGSIRTAPEQAVLLGLMAKHVSEDCDLYAYAGPHRGKSFLAVDLDDGTVLDNVHRVIQRANRKLDTDRAPEFPLAFLEDLLRERKEVDALLVVSSGQAPLGSSSDPGVSSISAFLAKYRETVNPHVLFVNVDLDKKGGVLAPSADGHPNDIHVAGFSGSVLSFLAERGDAQRLAYVEGIDVARGLPPPRAPMAAAKSSSSKAVPVPAVFLDKVKAAVAGTPRGGGGLSLDSSFGSSFSAPAASPARPSSPPPAGDDVVAPALPRRSAGEWATARVFISSTFVDMHGERDILTQYVFPQLRARAAALKVHVEEVDLRWGITEEQASSALLEVCLSEVDRCRPFFIGLLGSRYGHCPDAYDLPDDARFDRVRALAPGLSVTELEMQHGPLADPAASYAFFYLRERAFADAVPSAHRTAFVEAPGSAGEARLRSLRAEVATATNCCVYPAAWEEGSEGRPARASELEAFAERVLDDLWSAVVDHFPPVYACDGEVASAAATAATAHDNFGQRAASGFLGRERALYDLALFAERQDAVMAVVAPHGGGKSALLAKFGAEYAKAEPVGALPVVVVSHHVGVEAGPADLDPADARAVVLRLIVEVCSRAGVPLPAMATDDAASGPKVAGGGGGDLFSELPRERAGLVAALEVALRSASAKARVVVLIDGVDHLQPGDDLAAFLPLVTPARIVVSLTAAALGPFRTRGQQRAGWLDEYALPVLTSVERAKIVRARLARHRKSLDESTFGNQLKLLTGKADAGLPLFLVVACEELRVFGEHEKVTDKLRRLSSTVPRLIDDVLERLEAAHSRTVVERALALITVARGGLPMAELLALLGVPPATWLALRHALDVFVADGSSSPAAADTACITQHGVRAAIKKRYLPSVRREQDVHGELAEFFMRRADPAGDHSFAGADARALTELPYHLIRAESGAPLRKLLTSLRYVEEVVAAGQTRALLATYASAAPLVQRGGGAAEAVSAFAKFVSSSAHVFATAPHLVFQAAANAPAASPVAAAAEARATPAAPWVQWINKPDVMGTCALTLAGQRGDVVTAMALAGDGTTAAVAFVDGRVALHDLRSGRETGALPAKHRGAVAALAFGPASAGNLGPLASASEDGTARLWDPVRLTEEGVLKGHRRKVVAVAWGPEGRKVATASWDGSVKLWNVTTGKAIYTLAGHRGVASSVAFSCDGFFLASGGWDGAVVVWNARRGKEHRRFGGHEQSVRSVAFNGDSKQVASASLDGTLRLWSVETGKCLGKTGWAGSGGVTACSFSGDGACLVTGGLDASVRVWAGSLGRELYRASPQARGVEDGADDGACAAIAVCHDTNRALVGKGCVCLLVDVVTGATRATLHGHTGTVSCAAFQDTGVIATGSLDGTVRLWMAGGGQRGGRATLAAKAVLAGHRAAVSSVAFSSRGVLASASDDHTVLVWDPQARKELYRLEGHTNFVRGLAFSSTGRHLATVGRDSRLLVWNLKRREVVVDERASADWLAAVVWNGDMIVTTSWDNNARVWIVKDLSSLSSAPPAVEMLAELKGHQGCITTVDFHPLDDFMVTASLDGTVKVWDLPELTEVTTLQAHGHERGAGALFVADGKLLAVSERAEIALLDPLDLECKGTFAGHVGAVTHAAFLPAEAASRGYFGGFGSSGSEGSGLPRLATLARGDAMRVWDGARGTVPAHTTAVSTIAFAEDGSAAATSGDQDVRVWHVDAAGVRPGATRRCQSQVTAVALAPDGERLAIAECDSKEYAVCDAATGAVLASFPTSLGLVASLAFSSDGRRVLSGGWGGVEIADVQRPSGKPLFLEGCDDWVTSVAWVGSTSVAAASSNGNVYVWSLLGGKSATLAHTLRHDRWVNAVACSPNGRLLSSSSDGTAREWDLSTGEITRTLSRTPPRPDGEDAASGPPPVGGTCAGYYKGAPAVGWTDGALTLHGAQQEMEFRAAARVSALAVPRRGDVVAAGDVLGNVYFLRAN